MQGVDSKTGHKCSCMFVKLVIDKCTCLLISNLHFSVSAAEFLLSVHRLLYQTGQPFFRET